MRQLGDEAVRLAEVVAALSLATDLGTGFAYEHGLRSCLLAMRLAHELGLDETKCEETFYFALLRYAGCTADQHYTVALLGDEMALIKYLATADYNNQREMMGILFRHVGEDLPPLRRAGAVLGTFVNGMRLGGEARVAHQRAHCEVAQRTAARLGFGPAMDQLLAQVFEQWDGKGYPAGLRGEEIALPVRIVQFAEHLHDYYLLGGEAMAVSLARQRAGTLDDPGLVEKFCLRPGDLLAPMTTETPWDDVLAAEPGSPRWLTGDELDEASRAIADFADLKSFYTVGHSSGVADLTITAARLCHLPEGEITALHRAALIHDLGRIGVPLRIWEKRGPLAAAEWEQVRLHPYYTERVTARSTALAGLGALAALHHERLDGAGYHKGLPGTMLPPAARLLAAADAYHAMREDRAHRPALAPTEAANALRREAQAGRLDIEVTNAVLTAAGHRIRSTRRSHTAGLSDREIEVLRLLARGRSNQEMAQALSISKTTVGHHVQHIYDKIGVSTRAAATLYAMQYHLLIDPAGED